MQRHSRTGDGERGDQLLDDVAGASSVMTRPCSPTSTLPPLTAAARYLIPSTILLEEASQYCASAMSTRRTVICGSSSPCGNHALYMGFQSSWIFARSRLIAARPLAVT